MAIRTIVETIREYGEDGTLLREVVTETTEEYTEISYLPTYYPYPLEKERDAAPVITSDPPAAPSDFAPLGMFSDEDIVFPTI